MGQDPAADLRDLDAERELKSRAHGEVHRSQRAGWLRAAVLGSNDAIVSTASLLIGIAAAAATRETVVVAGIAGLVAGSMSMAAGEFVSVSSQRDAERADIALEKRELVADPASELRELASLYERRGLDAGLAMKVAVQISAHDRLEAHLRDELGIDRAALARPLQAAWISATSFALFATIPIVAAVFSSAASRIPAIAALSLASLAALGALGGHLGGASRSRAAVRVVAGGALAMAVSAAIGHLLGAAPG